MKKESNEFEELACQAIDTIEKLGNSPTARIDARAWSKHFKKKYKQIKKKHEEE